MHAAIGVSAASLLHPEGRLPIDAGVGYLLSGSAQTPLHGAYADGAWLHNLGRGWRISLGGRAEVLTSGNWRHSTLAPGVGMRLALERVWFHQRWVSQATQGECTQRVRPHDPPGRPGEPLPTEVECDRPALLVGPIHGNAGAGVALEYAFRALPQSNTSQQLTLALTFRLPAAALLLFAWP
jgi:hypothetical protein